jgi:GNAT superfamily N-acetyltransferase
MIQTFELIDQRALDTKHRTAISDLVARRAASIPHAAIPLPQSVDEVPMPEGSLVLLAWSGRTELAAMLLGSWYPNNEGALAVFEGSSPFVISLAYFAPVPESAAIPSPLALILDTCPQLDRITVHAPLADALTATALGRLGFTLDSYLEISIARDTRRTFAPQIGELRMAVPEDAAEIAALHKLHVRDQIGTSAFIGPDNSDLASISDEIAGRIGEEAIFYVSVINGELACAVEASCFDMPADGKKRRLPAGRAGVIEWVSTVAEYRRRGLGSALVAAAIEELLGNNLDYIYVCHGANNRLSSPSFWRRFGFVPAWGTWEMAIGGTGLA